MVLLELAEQAGAEVGLISMGTTMPSKATTPSRPPSQGAAMGLLKYFFSLALIGVLLLWLAAMDIWFDRAYRDVSGVVLSAREADRTFGSLIVSLREPQGDISLIVPEQVFEAVGRSRRARTSSGAS
jgi:hypothetical protein